MGSQAVMRVKRENIDACMKCPICYKLLEEATTISLCLHTFCRKCIVEKLSDEDVDCCPVCGIGLGCVPVEKLRPDHALQDIREKVFPFKKRKTNYLSETTAPSVVPPVVKRKERLLSSLGVSSPSVSLQTGKRTKTPPRRGSGSRCNSFIFEELNKKKQDKKKQDSIKHIAAAASGESNQRQESSSYPAEPSLPSENKENGAEGINELWKPLTCLVEAANITKSSSPSLVGATKSSKQHVVALPIPNMPLEAKPSKSMGGSKEGAGVRVKFQDNGSSSAPGVRAKRGRKPSQKKKEAALENSSISCQLLVDASQGNFNRHNIPIWFSLVAYEDRKGEASLPQISSGYLRIKNGNVPVSVIQKYIVQKLHLNNESEVEIRCRGQPVLPTHQLHHLVDLWFRTAATSERVTATVGTPAKDFVMVLSYSRKPIITID